jgi:hypothetical protein
MPCGGPAPGRPIGRPGSGCPQGVIGVFTYYQLLIFFFQQCPPDHGIHPRQILHLAKAAADGGDDDVAWIASNSLYSSLSFRASLRSCCSEGEGRETVDVKGGWELGGVVGEERGDFRLFKSWKRRGIFNCLSWPKSSKFFQNLPCFKSYCL